MGELLHYEQDVRSCDVRMIGLSLQPRRHIHRETVDVGRRRFPIKMVGLLLVMGVLLLVLAWHLNTRYRDVRLTVAWELPVGEVLTATSTPEGQCLVLTETGEFLSINAQGVQTSSRVLPVEQVIDLVRWGALVEYAGALYLEGVDGSSSQILPDFSRETHVFATHRGLLMAQAGAQAGAVGDYLQLWQAEGSQEWSWPDRVLLEVAAYEDGHVGVFLDGGADELTVMLCRFTAGHCEWTHELGSELPRGLMVVPGQIIVGLGHEVMAYGVGGERRWVYQTASAICCFISGARGSLLVEPLGSFDRHRFTHLDPLGERAWQRTLTGRVEAVQTGGGWHGLLLDGRLWLIEMQGGRVFRTQVLAQQIFLDGDGRYLTVVGTEGKVMRLLLDVSG